MERTNEQKINKKIAVITRKQWKRMTTLKQY